jgi:hypothetical protein
VPLPLVLSMFGNILLAEMYLPLCTCNRISAHPKHNMNNLVDRAGTTPGRREHLIARRGIPRCRRRAVRRSGGEQATETPAGHQQEVPADHRDSRVSTHSGVGCRDVGTVFVFPCNLTSLSLCCTLHVVAAVCVTKFLFFLSVQIWPVISRAATEPAHLYNS